MSTITRQSPLDCQPKPNPATVPLADYLDTMLLAVLYDAVEEECIRLEAEVAALQVRCAALSKALEVVLSKYNNHLAADIPDQITYCRYIGIIGAIDCDSISVVVGLHPSTAFRHTAASPGVMPMSCPCWEVLI